MQPVDNWSQVDATGDAQPADSEFEQCLYGFNLNLENDDMYDDEISPQEVLNQNASTNNIEDDSWRLFMDDSVNLSSPSGGTSFGGIPTDAGGKNQNPGQASNPGTSSAKRQTEDMDTSDIPTTSTGSSRKSQRSQSATPDQSNEKATFFMVRLKNDNGRSCW